MLKTKFFREDSGFALERAVNNFIQGRLVVNISYSVAPRGYEYVHCCCVLYNTVD